MKLALETKCSLNAPIHISALNIKEHPWHLHPDTMEIVYVLKGNVSLKRSIYNSNMRSGDIAVTNPDIIHYISSEEDNIVLIFHFDIQYFESHFSNLSDIIFVCDSSSNENDKRYFDSLKQRLASIYYDYTNYSAQDETSLLSNCISFISILTNHFCEWQQRDNKLITSSPYKKKPVQLDRLTRIINYLYSNFDKKITLDDVAKSEYISKYYVSRIISQGLGMSFQSYLNLIRVEYSQEYLYGTDLSINAISEKCGFSSPGFFRKIYEHYIGLTPLADRKKAKEHTIDYTPVVDFDLSSTAAEETIHSFLSTPEHPLSDYSITNNELDICALDINISEAKVLKTNRLRCFGHLSSVSELFSANTVTAIIQIHKYNCVDAISVDWNLLSKTFNYLNSWDFLSQLLSTLDSNKMDLTIINDDTPFCDEDAVYKSLTALVNKYDYTRIQFISSADIYFLSEDKFPSNQILNIISSTTQNIAIPVFKQNDAQYFLFNNNCTKSHYFYVILALNHLGREILENTDEYIITRDDDLLKILFQPQKKVSESQHKNFMLKLKNLKRDYICCIYNINLQCEYSIIKPHNNAETLLPQIVDLIDRKTFPKFNISEIEASTEYYLYVPSVLNEATLIEIF